MSDPTIHGKRRTISTSLVLETLGEDLNKIRKDDCLSYKDLGRVLGKSDDQAKKYCLGNADMGVCSYFFARREWGGRITGSLDQLVEGIRGDQTSDRQKETRILAAAVMLSAALTGDAISDADIRDNRATLEAAREALDALLSRARQPVLKAVQQG